MRIYLFLSLVLLWPTMSYESDLSKDPIYVAQARQLIQELELNKSKLDFPGVANPVTEQPGDKLWNLRDVNIRTVIDQVSQLTGKNFLVDSRVSGKISIVSSKPISNQELYSVFLSMLDVSGYTAIPNGDVVKILPNNEAKAPVLETDNIPEGEELLVEVIPVQHVPADQLVPVLKPLLPSWNNISAYIPSNMLILSGHANSIRQLAKIIRQVDNSDVNGVDVIPLHEALAMDVATTLKDLVKSNTRNPTTLAVDDRSNAILLSGNKTERIKIRLLINKLDHHNHGSNNSRTQVIYLSYLRAEDIVPILAGIAQANFSGVVGTTIGSVTMPLLDSTNPESNLANGPMTGGPANSPIVGLAGGKPNPAMNTTGSSTQNEGSTKPSIQIIAEPNTNSVILNAPPSLIKILKNVINKLDIKPAQLLVEALVAEINESDFNNLGVEWGSLEQVGEEKSAFRPGFAILNAKTSIKQFESRIYALARQHKANILSTPSVVVLDNRQAKILIGKQVSVATSSYPNNANASTTASPYTTFDRVNVALHLYVRPQITRGKGIQLQIDQGNDTLDSTNPLDASTNPTFNISAIVTSVHVESGDVIVLGGLAQDSLANDNNRLPILGDIPGIGRLFQHNIINREKKILMVFIRPHILNSEKNTIQISGSKYNQTRTEQLNLLRSQESYNEFNQASLMAPLKQAKLPKPFCKPPCHQEK